MQINMKKSGIKWVGEIPVSWETKRLKSVLSERKEKNNPIKTEFILSLTMDKGVIPYSEKTGGGNKAKDDLTQYKLAYPNDIVMNSMNILSGSVGLSKYFGAVSPAYYMLYTRDGHIVDYFNYLFQTNEFQKSLLGLGNGIMMKISESSGKMNTIRLRIPMSKLNDLLLPIPPIEEQKLICGELDEVIKVIDLIVKRTEESIEEYKLYKKSIISELVVNGIDNTVEMKDSGVEWIGNIPTHWKVNKGKYVLTLLKRPIIETDEVVTCFRDGEVTLRSNRREKGFTFADKEIGYQGVEPGDLIIHGMDGFAGAIGISDARGKSSPVLNVCDSQQNKKYLMYYLRSMAYNNVFLATSTGIRVRSCDLGWKKIAELPFPVPTIEEQNSIVELIDEKILGIDAILMQKERLLDELNRYKKVIIYETVTGKKGGIAYGIQRKTL